MFVLHILHKKYPSFYNLFEQELVREQNVFQFMEIIKGLDNRNGNGDHATSSKGWHWERFTT